MSPGITVTNLYRHPVKSMTPQPMESIDLTADGRVVGDRVFGFRFKNAGDPSDWSWQTKQNFVGLVNTPGLARLNVDFDGQSKILKVHSGDLLLIDHSVDSDESRAQIEEIFTDFVLSLDENPLEGHPERQPVVLVGDGKQPLFHDTAAGLVTLHGSESLDAVTNSLGVSMFDGRRFRSNVVVSGLNEPFEEMSWIGRNVAIGNSQFKVIKAVNRCLVTHANPVTGLRDHDVMNTLVRDFTPEKPQFAITLELISGVQKLAVGDSLTVLA